METSTRRSIAVLGLAVVLALLALGNTAHANLRPSGVGACGNPVANSGSHGDNLIQATDALAALEAAVTCGTTNGCSGCIPLICDVDSSGSVTATDAARILNAAVGNPVTLNCPSSVTTSNCPLNRCLCHGTTIVERFATMSAADPKDWRNWPARSIPLFIRCNDLINPAPTASNPHEIVLSASPITGWRPSIAKIPFDDVVIDARHQHVVFSSSRPCFNRCVGTCSGPGSFSCTQSSECPSGRTCSVPSIDQCTSNAGCSGGATCSALGCPEILQGAVPFLKLAGDNIEFYGGDNPSTGRPKITGFFDGFSIEGESASIRNVTLERQCHDSIVAQAGAGYGSVIRDTKITHGCDQCVQLHAGTTTPLTPGVDSACNLPDVLANANAPDPSADCYHASLIGVDFEGCDEPIRVAPSRGDDSQTYFRDVTVTELAGQTDTSTDQFACTRTFLNGNDSIGDFINFHSVGCDRGLALGGSNSTYNLIGGSSISLSEKIGLEVVVTDLSAGASVRDAEIFDNAGFKSTNAALGGVALAGGSTADLGPSGGSKLCCNKDNANPPNAREIHNESGKTINARGNYWCANNANPNNAVTNGTGSTTLTGSTLGSDPFPASGQTCSAR